MNTWRDEARRQTRTAQMKLKVSSLYIKTRHYDNNKNSNKNGFEGHRSCSLLLDLNLFDCVHTNMPEWKLIIISTLQNGELLHQRLCYCTWTEARSLHIWMWTEGAHRVQGYTPSYSGITFRVNVRVFLGLTACYYA